MHFASLLPEKQAFPFLRSACGNIGGKIFNFCYRLVTVTTLFSDNGHWLTWLTSADILSQMASVAMSGEFSSPCAFHGPQIVHPFLQTSPERPTRVTKPLSRRRPPVSVFVSWLPLNNGFMLDEKPRWWHFLYLRHIGFHSPAPIHRFVMAVHSA